MIPDRTASASRVAGSLTSSSLASLCSVARSWLAAATLACLAACGGAIEEGNDDAAYVRAVNVIADSATVQLLIDNTPLSSVNSLGYAVGMPVDYAAMTAYGTVHARTSALQLAVPSPDDLTGAAKTYTNIGPGLQQPLVLDRDYTVIAYGTVASPQMFLVEGTGQRTAVEDNRLVWQIVHAASSLGSVDVYLTAPETGVATPVLISNLNLQQATPPAQLTFTSTDTATLTANMVLELRQAGSSTVLYRSPTIAVAEQTRVLFVIVDPQGPGAAPAELITLSGTGSAAGSRQADVADDAELRLAHVSSEAPALDLIGGPGLATTFASNIAFGAASAYQSVPNSVANGVVATVGTDTGNTSADRFVYNLTAAPGTSYSLYATGPLSDMAAVPLVDDRRAIPLSGRTSFRFLHAASSLSASIVNVYLTPPGTALDLNSRGLITPQVSSLAYRTASNYQLLKAGGYDVYFVRGSETSPVLGPVAVQLTEGQGLTFALVNTPGTGALAVTPFVDSRP